MMKTSELCEAQETRNSKSLIWQKWYSVPFRSERFSKTLNGVTTYYNKVRNLSYEFAVLSKNKILRDF